MEIFNPLVFQKFCARVIENEKWASDTPIPITLLDGGQNPAYEMTARKNEDGVFVFEKADDVKGTLSRPGPYTVQFMVDGKPVLRTFPSN
jgi:hypothetical protein